MPTVIDIFDAKKQIADAKAAKARAESLLKSNIEQEEALAMLSLGYSCIFLAWTRLVMMPFTMFKVI